MVIVYFLCQAGVWQEQGFIRWLRVLSSPILPNVGEIGGKEWYTTPIDIGYTVHRSQFMNSVGRYSQILLVLLCVFLLLLLSTYALSMLPPVIASTVSVSSQLPDLVVKLTPSVSHHHPISAP